MTPEILDFIKSVGVPAAITFFVLWRVDKRLDDLTKAIQDLCKKVKIEANNDDT